MKIRYSESKSLIAKVIHSSSEKWVQLHNCEGKFGYNGLPRLKFDPTTPYKAVFNPYAYEHCDCTAMPDISYVSAVEHGDYSNSEEIKPYLLYVYPHVFRNCTIILSHIDSSDCDFHIVAEQGLHVGDVISNYRYADVTCFQSLVASDIGGAL